MANNILKKISFTENANIQVTSPLTFPKKKKNLHRKITTLAFILIILSVTLFIFARDTKQGWIAITKAVTWTFTVIIAWYMLVNPLLIRLIKSLLKKQQGRYNEEVTKIISFIPVLKGLTAAAWQKSKALNGWNRMSFFLITVINWSLTYSEKEAEW